MTKVYFFKNDEYLRWTIGEGADLGYPKQLSNWHPFLANGVDAAVHWGIRGGKAKVYFFKGTEYLRWTIGEGADLGYPKQLSNWHPFLANGVDAAVNWGIVNGKPKVYFFKGTEYLRWTIGEGADLGYPKQLSNWHPFLANGVDAAVNWGIRGGEPQVYFFKGNEYARHTIGEGISSSYPKPLSNWCPFIENGIDAAINWSMFTSLHGFHFSNSFSGLPLPFPVPSLPGLPPISATYGLCGGMAAAACDFYLAGRTTPIRSTAPAKNTDLYQYLYKRLMDTFGALGENIVKMGVLMSLPDNTQFGIQKTTWDEFEAIRSKLDDGQPVVLGLVRLQTNDTLEIWKNHQVLAYGYSKSSNGDVTINIYDPNHPDKNSIRIKATKVVVATGLPPNNAPIYGFSCIQSSGESIRGFFLMAYVPVNPPAGL